ncbi:MAG TPA: Ku protein [Gemmataceae bacterium]|nr:Ku protein [Gemmataceae bacterium]
MAARSSWKGFLKLSLISIPVKAYTATASGSSGIHLNQLHAECNSRINYKKTCPIHGEIPSDQIVSGYEYSKGQYVIVDTDELDKLRTEDDKAINIDTFIRPDTLDQMYASGKCYYLIPDGPVAQKPYTVLHQGMVDSERYGIAKVVMSGKEQVVLLRPVDSLITMTQMSYDHEITKPSTFEDELVKTPVEAEELKLIKTLIDASTPKKFDLSQYKDVYTQKLTQLIEAKVAGKEIVAPPVQEQAHIINLMDALRQSVAKAQKEAPAAVAGKPPKKMAPSVQKPERAARKKKSG